MKNTRTILRCVAIAAVLATVLGALLMFVACNKDKPKTVDDIFKSDSSPAELTTAKEEFMLPAGWQVYTSAPTGSSTYSSDGGYIKDLDAFVIVRNANGAKTPPSGSTLSIRLCGSDKVFFEDGEPGMMFPESLGIIALRVNHGLIACKFNDGSAGVFDYSGRTVLSSSKISNTTSTAINNFMAILCDGLIAVHSNYDVNGLSGYTSIYRPYYNSANLSDCGKLVCRVANKAGNMSYVKGFEGKYVCVSGNSDGVGMYRIPDSADTVRNFTGNDGNSFVVATNGKSNYKSEITYVGKGKFYISEDWTVQKSDDYTYTDGSSYYVVQRRIYTPDNDKVSNYTANSNKLFMQMSNNYYDGGNISGLDTTAYLKDGYTYAAYGLTIVDKVGLYDQFILDENLNIVMSLTGNYGITLDEKRTKVGHFDMILFNMDGYTYVPYYPSEVAIYQGDKKVGSNSAFTTQIVNQELSNGILVATITDVNDTSGNSLLYGAFDVHGNKLIDFKYTALNAFRGNYTLATRYDEENRRTKYCIVGSDGREVTAMSDGSQPLADMATNTDQKYIYKVGCYMYRVPNGEGHYLFGVKNFNPDTRYNIIMEAKMKEGSMLYAPNSSPRDVFVFEKLGADANTTWIVYRLV